MLSAEEFSVGPLGDAAPLTLMIPRTKYEHHFLIGGAQDDPISVCFTDPYRYRAFRCAGNDAHKGMLVPNMRIEVDPNSLLDPGSDDVPLGAVVRRGTILGVVAQLEGGGFHSAQTVPLVQNLADAREGYAVGFRRWAVTLGTGDECRILLEVDLTQAERDRATRA